MSSRTAALCVALCVLLLATVAEAGYQKVKLKGSSKATAAPYSKEGTTGADADVELGTAVA
jgi:hypothetical protein